MYSVILSFARYHLQGSITEIEKAKKTALEGKGILNTLKEIAHLKE